MNEEQKSLDLGEAIKRRAMSGLNLNPQQTQLFQNQKIRAIPQDQLTAMSDPGFDSPGLTDASDINNIKMYVADNLPIVPRLGFNEYMNLPPYITEKDVIPHEMGHMRDWKNNGETSEPTAIAYEDSVKGQGFSPLPSARTPSIQAFNPFSMGLRRLSGDRNVINYWQDDMPNSLRNDGRYYPKGNNQRY